MQTASLADLWAAYNFVKGEIEKEIIDIRMSDEGVLRLYHLRKALEVVRQEISIRVYSFIVPPIKA